MSSIHLNYSEKRDFMRMKIDTAVTLSFGDPLKEVEGLCKDLSSSGISVEVEQEIPLGTECNVTIHDGKTNLTKFQARIEIKRCQSTGHNSFVLGAQILEMN